MNNISPLPPSAWPPLFTPNDFGDLNALINMNPQMPNYIGIDRIREGGEGGADMARFLNRQIWPLKESEAAFSMFGGINCKTRVLTATSRPLTGTTMSMQVAKTIPTDPDAFQFLIYGNSDVQANGIPLPVPLPFDLSCSLHISPDVIGPMAGIDNTPVQIPVSIPNTPSLVGACGFFQTVGLETTTLAFVMSTAGKARIGNN